jgi:hypothetical protein
MKGITNNSIIAVYKVPTLQSQPISRPFQEIKTQLIRFGQSLTKLQVAGKPTKELGMMCLRLVNEHSGTFFNKMAIFQTFSRLYQRNHRIPIPFQDP